jgi:hypothetical protein
MLRWFWWRINAWSEISAMSAAGISSLLLQSRAATWLVERLRAIDPRLPAGPLNATDPQGFAWLMILVTVCTTVTWLAVTFLTPPEPAAKLRQFYERVRPAAAGWRVVAGVERDTKQNLMWSAADWIGGCALIYCSLFGIGFIIFAHVGKGIALLATAALCATFIFWDLGRRGGRR